MRPRTVLRELRARWSTLRTIYYGLLLISLVYPVAMHFIVEMYGRLPQSLLEYRGVAGHEMQTFDMYVAAIVLCGAALFPVFGIIAHRLLLNPKLEKWKQLPMGSGFPDTPRGNAFGRYFTASIYGPAFTEPANLIGVFAFLMLGRFLTVILPLMAVVLAVKLLLMPTEGKLRRYLESVEGEAEASSM